MNPHTSHDRLWQKRLDALTAVWPSFVDGETSGLHKVRVASRRLREALPLVAATAPPAKVKKLKRRLRDLTRHLGPIRELDVELDLLDSQADADIVPRGALVLLRREVAARRQALRLGLDEHPPVVDIKRLVRKLEKIGKREGQRGKGKAANPAVAWRSVLAARLLRRARALGAAIEAAGPLYTPERIHGVRICAKKLRYALEIAQEAAVPHAGDLVAALKEHQERLGRLHDFQGLLKRVREAETSPRAGSRIGELTAYADVLERECRRLHADFIEHRDELVDCLREVKHDLVPALTTRVARRQARVSKANRATRGVHGKRAV